jgi:hypothetical protein
VGDTDCAQLLWLAEQQALREAAFVASVGFAVRLLFVS